jgi:periplasmic divalent cation tolerance protein
MAPSSDSIPPALVVLVTAASQEEARSLARLLVEAGEAACVNVVPGVTSIYRWEGRVEEAPEWLLVIKTTPARRAALEALVRARHSCDVPEILALPVWSGSEAYLEWLRTSVRPS